MTPPASGPNHWHRDEKRPPHCALRKHVDLHTSQPNQLWELLHRGPAGAAQTEVTRVNRQTDWQTDRPNNISPWNLRHNITAPALRGYLNSLTDDTNTVVPSRMVGVTDGCPVSLLVNRLYKQFCKPRQSDINAKLDRGHTFVQL